MEVVEEGGGRVRMLSGFLLAPVAFAALWLAPLDVPVPAHRLAAVLGAVIVLWISEAIPMAMTAFLGVAVTVPLGIATSTEAFAPFADPLIFLFIGTFSSAWCELGARTWLTSAAVAISGVVLAWFVIDLYRTQRRSFWFMIALVVVAVVVDEVWTRRRRRSTAAA